MACLEAEEAEMKSAGNIFLNGFLWALLAPLRVFAWIGQFFEDVWRKHLQAAENGNEADARLWGALYTAMVVVAIAIIIGIGIWADWAGSDS